MYLELSHKLTKSKVEDQSRHLSRFCNSKVIDNGSKVYLTQNV